MRLPAPDTVCPAHCGELGSRILFLRFFSDRLPVWLGLHEADVLQKSWERLADALKDITLTSSASGLHTLLLDRAVGRAFGQFEPTLKDLVGVDETARLRETFEAAVHKLLSCRPECAGCRDTSDLTLAVLPADSAKSTICVTPLLEIFRESREFAQHLMNEWGLVDFDSWSEPYGVDFMRYERSAALLAINLNTQTITVFTGGHRYKLPQYLQLRFAFFHEWSGHVATRLAIPGTFCDDFGLHWQKEVYLANADVSNYEYRMVRNVDTIPDEDEQNPGLASQAGETAVLLMQTIRAFLISRRGVSKGAAAGVAWEMVGKLSIAAAHVHGPQVYRRFLRPLYALLAGGDKRFVDRLWEVLDRRLAGEEREPFSSFVSVVSGLRPILG